MLHILRDVTKRVIECRVLEIDLPRRRNYLFQVKAPTVLDNEDSVA